MTANSSFMDLNHCSFSNSTFAIVTGGGFKILLSIGTIFGNCLVIAAVATDSRLRTAATNLFIVSLALADLLMGLVVMPFGTMNEFGPATWFFGRTWCDGWRATDVLSSTASILSLTLIAAERHHATTGTVSLNHHPHHRFSPTVSMIMVIGVWILSICISYPAIVWWRLVEPTDLSISLPPCTCHFTTDASYILVSSCVSFYLPLAIMLILYARIYRTAKSTIRCLKRGEKIIESNDESSKIVLRIHRGGGGTGGRIVSGVNSGITKRGAGHKGGSQTLSKLISKQKSKSISHPLGGMVDICSGPVTSSSTIGHKLRHCAITKKISKFNTEQKAAKTLGFVMGTFILCWLPFFICNVIVALDTSQSILPSTSIVLPIVTWLGYLNSCVNPIIYAHSMRNFRNAFIKILCPSYYRRKMNRSLAYTMSTRPS